VAGAEEENGFISLEVGWDEWAAPMIKGLASPAVLQMSDASEFLSACEPENE